MKHQSKEFEGDLSRHDSLHFCGSSSLQLGFYVDGSVRIVQLDGSLFNLAQRLHQHNGCLGDDFEQLTWAQQMARSFHVLEAYVESNIEREERNQ